MEDVADTMTMDEEGMPTSVADTQKKTKEPAIWMAILNAQIGVTLIRASSKKELLKKIDDELSSSTMISVVAIMRGKEFSVKEKKSYEIM